MPAKEENRRADGLSRREVEVLKLGAQGATDGEISDQLAISVPTLRTYWLRIREKIGGVNRTHAIALAVAGPLADQDDPRQRMLQQARSASVAEWVWRPAKRQVELDGSSKKLFGIAADDKALPLERLLDAVWPLDQGRFERFLVQSTEIGPFTAIDVRLGPNGDYRQTIRTINMLTHRTKVEGVSVLFASTVGRSG